MGRFRIPVWMMCNLAVMARRSYWNSRNQWAKVDLSYTSGTALSQKLRDSANELEQPQTNSTYANLAVGTWPHESKIFGTRMKKNFQRTLQKLWKVLRRAHWQRERCYVLSTVSLTSMDVIVGKILLSEVCIRKLKWDEEVLDDIHKPWT